jgi:ribosomal protein S16
VAFWHKQGAQPSDSERTLIKHHLTPAPVAAPAAVEAK